MRVMGLMRGTSADGVDAAIIYIRKNKVSLLALDMSAVLADYKCCSKIISYDDGKTCPASGIFRLYFYNSIYLLRFVCRPVPGSQVL